MYNNRTLFFISYYFLYFGANLSVWVATEGSQQQKKCCWLGFLGSSHRKVDKVTKSTRTFSIYWGTMHHHSSSHFILIYLWSQRNCRITFLLPFLEYGLLNTKLNCSCLKIAEQTLKIRVWGNQVTDQFCLVTSKARKF